MRIVLASDVECLGRYAAKRAAEVLREAVARQGSARMVVATGASQFTVLDSLVARDDVPWESIDGFHLDEYIGISQEHPASFCRYLRERLVDRVPLRSFHFLPGDQDPQQTIAQATRAIQAAPIDVAMVGIGENGHLAFNDPPADFETTAAYITVPLDQACRQQQVGEGWFGSLEEVPREAISMTVHQILAARTILCSVPDARKAPAVRDTVEGPITPQVPATALRRHADCTLLLDPPAASLLAEASRERAETASV